MNLSQEETKLFAQLNTPHKIQDFLDSLAINFENSGDTCSSPRAVLKRKSAHCIEAALLAYAIMLFNGEKPMLLDLKANDRDFDHVVCLFRRKGKWGAISKSNHAGLRYRDPIYANPRELAMSYFHEYINDGNERTLRSYSVPYSLQKYRISWVTDADDLWEIANDLDEVRHLPILPRGIRLRKADKLESRAGDLVEWSHKTGKMVKYRQ
jgi:hypothetical protein